MEFVEKSTCKYIKKKSVFLIRYNSIYVAQSRCDLSKVFCLYSTAKLEVYKNTHELCKYTLSTEQKFRNKDEWIIVFVKT